jgi:hypothetical protein
LNDAESYIWHRLAVAGRSDGVFQRRAIKIIHEHSGGIPRLINQLCDLSLVYGFAEQARIVTPEIVERVLRDRTRHAAGRPFDSDADGASLTDPAETHPPPRNDGIVPQRA